MFKNTKPIIDIMRSLVRRFAFIFNSGILRKFSREMNLNSNRIIEPINTVPICGDAY
ncbi:MAG TPA: hypothetical protein VE818_09630 [Nitrososphaeraceae archaeon]|nr:hypothetical protein [Nitrososphaeraceae archaeon]